jgi:hypothetical protein
MSKTEESPEERIGKILNIYRELAIALNSFPKEATLSIGDLARKAQVHYSTAKKALLFLHQIDSLIPKFKIQGKYFKVISKPNALEAVEGIFESLEMRVLTKMMLVEATSLERARKLDDLLTEEEKNILPRLVEMGYINSIEGRFFLSQRGQSLGSMGLSRIVKLNIPLPWENRARTTQLETSAPDFPFIPQKTRFSYTQWMTVCKRYQNIEALTRKERRFVIAAQ